MHTVFQDPMFWGFMLFVGVPILVGIFWFIFNLLRSIAINMCFVKAPPLGALRTWPTRASKLEQLPVIPCPPRRYLLKFGELKSEDVETVGTLAFIEAIELSFLSVTSGDYRVVWLKGANPDLSTFVVSTKASPFTRLLGWFEIEHMGNGYEWRLYGSETRHMRTPEEDNSHFKYHAGHDHRLFNIVKRFMGNDMLEAVWDLLTANVVTEGTASNASKFVSFMMYRLGEAQSGGTSRLFATTAPRTSTAQRIVPEVETERRRPVRRD